MDVRTIRAISILISGEAGHAVELFGLTVCRLEDGRYSVTDDSDGEEVLFKSSVKAAKYFERMRNKRKKGYDFENNERDSDV